MTSEDQPPERLLTLVEDGDVETLLTIVTVEDIADAWVRASQWLDDEECDPGDDPNWWAALLWMSTPWWSDLRRVRDALVVLAERAPDESVLAHVGAGPLENFLTPDENTLRWVERTAAESSKFRTALANVWVDFNEQTMARLDRAAGVPLARPRAAR